MSGKEREQVAPDPGTLQEDHMNDSVSSQNTATNQVPFRPCERIFPCTVKQLKEGTTSDGRFLYGNCTPSHVTVVARVIYTQVQMMIIRMFIDDGTQGMNAVYIFGVEEDQTSVLQRAQQFSWVRLIGQMGNMGGSNCLSVFRIRRVEDGNEVVYHRLDVVRTWISFHRHHAGQHLSAVSHGFGLTVEEKAVYEYIKGRHASGEKNISVAQVLRDSTVQSEVAARNVLESIASEGIVYALPEVDHYAFCKY